MQRQEPNPGRRTCVVKAVHFGGCGVFRDIPEFLWRVWVQLRNPPICKASILLGLELTETHGVGMLCCTALRHLGRNPRSGWSNLQNSPPPRLKVNAINTAEMEQSSFDFFPTYLLRVGSISSASTVLPPPSLTFVTSYTSQARPGCKRVAQHRVL